jgi:hypothetical protein
MFYVFLFFRNLNKVKLIGNFSRLGISRREEGGALLHEEKKLEHWNHKRGAPPLVHKVELQFVKSVSE